ncbi:PEP-CTERM sorting domain-containing protein [Chamaesiphon sp. VAR_48_metabat_135_sub]|uniref:PEP-CTERM sorting domain-containing protein n=1 Tax=Chamaesiphon sp. VAR_48_metabat_135_sub TaxID=2964699 RepID=UPI00286CBD80|nr:PEP-CTERM sorting domain-containing protein [Chamaesiphon sp. VAR_48_metabat_135_sub]
MKPNNSSISTSNGSLLSIGGLSLLTASVILCQSASAAVFSTSIQAIDYIPTPNVVPLNTTPAIDYIPKLNVVPLNTTPVIDYIPKLNVVSLNTTTAIDYIPTLTTPGSNLLPRPSNLTPQEVPEPFTIIGTLLGGTAAFRMKKKLNSSTKM